MTKLKFIHDLSIKNKLILIILLVIFLIHSIAFQFITSWDLKRIESDLQMGLILNTKLIAHSCITPLTFDDDEQATIALSHLKTIGFIEEGYLLDKEGNLFAYYPETLDKKGLTHFSDLPNTTFKDDFIYVSEPVMFQNKVYGTLNIKASTLPYKKAKKTILITLILLSLTLYTLAIFLAIKLQKYISKPIIDLKKHFETLTQTHDFSIRIEKHNNDEVGQLYDEFNNLTTQIQHRREERDVAEKQLRESQEKLELALQGVGIGVWELDLKTNRSVWDANMEDIFGVEKGTYKQTYEDFEEYLHPEDIPRVRDAIRNALNGTGPYDITYRIMSKKTEVRYINAKGLVSRDKNGNPIKMLGICFDVTEIKDAEHELKRHRDNLEELVRERTKKLEAKNVELESFNQLFMDREFRIKELRDEIAQLKAVNNK